MKIEGVTQPTLMTKVISFEKPSEEDPEQVINLTIRAIPLGLDERMAEHLPYPVPPEKFLRRGGKSVRDKDGGHKVVPNLEDPKYKREDRRIHGLHAVAILHEGLKGDPKVSWNTPAPENDAWDAYYTGILQELKAMNFTGNDITFIVKEITDLSSNKMEQLEEAEEGF